MVKFYEFASVCYESDSIRGKCKKYEFPNHLAYLFMHEPQTDEEEALEDRDEYYPFIYKDQSGGRKIFRGDNPVPVKAASRIRDCFDATKFTDIVFDLSQNLEAFDLFKKSFERIGIEFEPDDDVGEKLTEIFKKILTGIIEGASGIQRDSASHTEPQTRRRLEEVSPSGVFLDRKNHKIVVDGESIQVTPILFSEEIQPEEQKYIAALLEAYASKKGRYSLSMEELKDFDFLYDDLKTQRRYFFDAASVYHAVRDAFVNGDEEFKKLKDEAYEGIREVYISEYPDGYTRLLGVLTKITSTRFDKSKLMSLTGLIGNPEKKGICHMLVEDGKIKTWVIKY